MTHGVDPRKVCDVLDDLIDWLVWASFWGMIVLMWWAWRSVHWLKIIAQGIGH